MIIPENRQKLFESPSLLSVFQLLRAGILKIIAQRYPVSCGF